jgi:hypothetical protein
MASRNKVEEVLQQTVHSQASKTGTIHFDFYGHVWTSFVAAGQLTDVYTASKFKAFGVRLLQRIKKKKKGNMTVL